MEKYPQIIITKHTVLKVDSIVSYVTQADDLHDMHDVFTTFTPTITRNSFLTNI
jgi:hypothetical protein